MPQTSPMNWMLISLSPLLMNSTMISLSKMFFSKMEKSEKSANKVKKWTW